MLCSYVPLGGHDDDDDDETAPTCNDVGTCVHSTEHEDITDLTDATCEDYCLSAAESNGGTIECGQNTVMCQLASADDLLHELSNGPVRTIRNSSYATDSADRGTAADAENSRNDIVSNRLSGLDVGRVGFRAKLRANVETLTELKLWQKEFAERSKTTMRYANVSVCTGKKTLYKVNFVYFVSCFVFLGVYFQYMSVVVTLKWYTRAHATFWSASMHTSYQSYHIIT